MHDETERRRRGRPKGSTRYAKHDAAVLGRAADLMICDDKMTVTGAIKLVTAEPTNETLLHRLRGKMKPSLSQQLADARARAAHRVHAKQAQAAELGGLVKNTVQAWKEGEALFHHALTSPSGRAVMTNVLTLQVALNHAAARVEASSILQGVANLARHAEQSGLGQWLRDVQRLTHANSFQRQVQEMQQSGTGQWLRDVQRLTQTDSFQKQVLEVQRLLEPLGLGKPVINQPRTLG
jgi:hypothetical protein